MRQITDFAEVSSLVMKYFKRNVITNNFLTPLEYKTEIAENRLFCKSEDTYLQIFLRRDGFYIMYFHALDEDVKFSSGGENIICDFSGDDKGILLKNGFSVYNSRVRLKSEFSGIFDNSCEYADLCDGHEIHSLLNKNLDRFSGFVPTVSLIEAECKNKSILVAKKDNRIIGALRFDVTKKTAYIRHLCVDADYRKQGISRLLVSQFLKESRDKKRYVWTGSENLPALNLYKSYGFVEDGVSSVVYSNF